MHRLSLLALLTLLPGSAHADELEGTLLSLKMTGGMTPYRVVTYEVLWRKKVAVAGQYRGLVNYDEAIHQMKLVDKDEMLAFLKRVRAAGGFDLTDAPKAVAPAPLTFEVELRFKGEHKTWKVTSPDAQKDPRYRAVVDVIRGFVLKRTGDLAFRNVFFQPGTIGYVNLTSFPPANVFIDGRDTKHTTPVYGYELPAGAHTVKLVAIKEGWFREHTLQVQPGITTIVHFDLR